MNEQVEYLGAGTSTEYEPQDRMDPIFRAFRVAGVQFLPSPECRSTYQIYYRKKCVNIHLPSAPKGIQRGGINTVKENPQQRLIPLSLVIILSPSRIISFLTRGGRNAASLAYIDLWLGLLLIECTRLQSSLYLYFLPRL